MRRPAGSFRSWTRRAADVVAAFPIEVTRQRLRGFSRVRCPEDGKPWACSDLLKIRDTPPIEQSISRLLQPAYLVLFLARSLRFLTLRRNCSRRMHVAIFQIRASISYANFYSTGNKTFSFTDNRIYETPYISLCIFVFVLLKVFGMSLFDLQ